MQREAHLSNAALMARRHAAVARGVGQAHEIFISRGENAEIWDVEGRRYISGLRRWHCGAEHRPLPPQG